MINSNFSITDALQKPVYTFVYSGNHNYTASAKDILKNVEKITLKCLSMIGAEEQPSNYVTTHFQRFSKCVTTGFSLHEIQTLRNSKSLAPIYNAYFPKRTVVEALKQEISSAATSAAKAPASLLGKISEIASRKEVLIGAGIGAAVIGTAIAYKAFTAKTEKKEEATPVATTPAASPSLEAKEITITTPSSTLASRVQTLMSNLFSKISSLFAKISQLLVANFRRLSA